MQKKEKPKMLNKYLPQPCRLLFNTISSLSLPQLVGVDLKLVVDKIQLMVV